MATACTPATTLSLPRLPATSASASARCLGLPRLPRRSSAAPLSASFNQFTELSQRCSFKTRAASSEETSLDATELFEDLKAKWDATENKTTVIVYGGGAVVAIWLSTVVVGAINTVPLLPKIMELVGLGYTGWFVYRYLLFKSCRKELAADIESLKKKIAGTE